MIDFWITRREALVDLEGVASREAATLSEVFTLLDQTLEDLERFFLATSDLARVASLAGVKGRNLALACYSLSLDGLAQESGAILRPLLETIELVKYVRIVPDGAEKAINRSLPSPGVRAKAVDGSFKSLRDALSSDASHMDFSYTAIRHTVDLASGRMRLTQPHRREVLRRNLGMVCVFTIALLRELADVLSQCDTAGRLRVTIEGRYNSIGAVNKRARLLFFPEVASGGKALVDLPLSGSVDDQSD